MDILPGSDAERWSAADLEIFRSFNAVGATVDPAVPLPKLVAQTFAPRGPLEFERCAMVLREALFHALLPVACAAAAGQIAAKFHSDAWIEAGTIWLRGVGAGMSARH